MRVASCCCGSFGMYGRLEAFRYIGRAPSSSQRLETKKGSEALEREELDAKLRGTEGSTRERACSISLSRRAGSDASKQRSVDGIGRLHLSVWMQTKQDCAALLGGRACVVSASRRGGREATKRRDVDPSGSLHVRVLQWSKRGYAQRGEVDESGMHGPTASMWEKRGYEARRGGQVGPASLKLADVEHAKPRSCC